MPNRFRGARGFTLVELMVVIAIIVLIAGLSTGALRGLAEGSRLSKALIGISGAMEAARQSAISSGTYTWVGMSSAPDPTTKANTITVATFASSDGTRGDGASPTNMRLISKVEQFDGVKLLATKPGGNQLDEAKLPKVENPGIPTDSTFQPKSSDVPSRITLPFDWVVVFTPRGEACIDAGGSPASGTTGASGDDLRLTQAIRMWVTSSKGNTPSNLESMSASMIQVNGITGQVDVYHP